MRLQEDRPVQSPVSAGAKPATVSDDSVPAIGGGCDDPAVSAALRGSDPSDLAKPPGDAVLDDAFRCPFCRSTRFRTREIWNLPRSPLRRLALRILSRTLVSSCPDCRKVLRI